MTVKKQLLSALCLSSCVLCAWALLDAPEGLLEPKVLKQILYEEAGGRLQFLGRISDAEGSLERRFFSPAHIRAGSQIRKWMREAGLRTWQDGVGNMHGRLDGRARDAPALLMGSHYDTVTDAGKYDGALGIVVAIAAVKALILQAASAARLMRAEDVRAAVRESADLGQWLGPKAHDLLAAPLEIIAFSDEEGVRFQTTFLGSRAVTGQLVPLGMLDAEDRNGETLADVLYKHGFQGSEEALGRTAYPPDAIRGYVEVHMEQGPVLQASGFPLGPVAAIAGQTRLAVSVLGTQGHAGTVPMKLRKDAAAAVAEAMVWIERHCGGGPQAPAVGAKLGTGEGQEAPPAGKEAGSPAAEAAGDAEEGGEDGVDAEGSAEAGDAEEGGGSVAEGGGDDSLVCTTGAVSLWPGASNVIAGAANFSVDIRCRSDAVREATAASVRREVGGICGRRGLACSIETRHEAPAAAAHPDIIAGLVAACRAAEQVTAGMLGETGSECPWEGTPAGELRAGAGGAPERVARELLGAAPCGGGKKRSRWDNGKAPVLVSGAGHDALPMSNITKMGMLFVRDRGGISHSPLEFVADEDIAAAGAALYMYLNAECT